MKLLNERPDLRRIVFWGALAVMLVSALVGMLWGLIEREWLGVGPVACLALGVGAAGVAAIFRLLELAHPTYHPESHLFSWDDVDSLRQLSRRSERDPVTRDLARSLADRIAIVLPGRPPQGQSQPKTPAVKRP